MALVLVNFWVEIQWVAKGELVVPMVLSVEAHLVRIVMVGVALTALLVMLLALLVEVYLAEIVEVVGVMPVATLPGKDEVAGLCLLLLRLAAPLVALVEMSGRVQSMQIFVEVVSETLAFSGLVEQLACLDFLVALWVLVASGIQPMAWVEIPQVAQPALVELVDLCVRMVRVVTMVQALGRLAVYAVE
jgi:hypothetical protein